MILFVENTRFIVNPTLLISKPDTMLGRMFALKIRSSASSSLNDGTELVRPNERNEYEVADGLSANCFGAILVNFYSIKNLSKFYLTLIKIIIIFFS